MLARSYNSPFVDTMSAYTDFPQTIEPLPVCCRITSTKINHSLFGQVSKAPTWTPIPWGGNIRRQTRYIISNKSCVLGLHSICSKLWSVVFFVRMMHINQCSLQPSAGAAASLQGATFPYCQPGCHMPMLVSLLFHRAVVQVQYVLLSQWLMKVTVTAPQSGKLFDPAQEFYWLTTL